KFLTEYSEIPDDKILPHVYEIRDKAWAIRSYPCTGQGLFLNSLITRSPVYSEVLEKLKAGGRLVEVGSFIGHDMRRMAFDGAPSSNFYAVDIVNHWDVGYSMFNDREKFHAHFIESDIVHTNSQLQELNGTVDIIYISKVFHQWDWDTQFAALRSIIALSKPGAIVFGFHAGTIQGGLLAYSNGGLTMWLHDETSWTRIWEEAGKETGTKWDAGQVSMRDISEMASSPESLAWLDGNCRLMDFVARRLE
ncbi:uncharacterized protein LY89DRAFT_594965, partial [Mollisia scopiformis]